MGKAQSLTRQMNPCSRKEAAVGGAEAGRPGVVRKEAGGSPGSPVSHGKSDGIDSSCAKKLLGF